MGNAICKPRSKETRTLRFKSKDWPYVDAIRKNTMLEGEVSAPANKQPNLPVQISHGLFLSDANGATNIKRLKYLGITHVLNVAGQVGSRIPDEVYDDAGIVVQIIEAIDEDSYPILQNFLEITTSFINVAKHSGGACLVHCNAGINRSCVLVAAYKMINERMNVLEVVSHCRQQRGNIFLSSNQGFQEQLVALARREGLLG
mmetsp:Transcript_7974/g.10685  ORF Transcript_7974/g.10685 Transcript_7974/m.10685 type:complete len:202 (+) Transcript_7974:164-769(+)